MYENENYRTICEGKMKTSIVLCSYNGEKYLVEQLDSLRNQSCPADEVIICDDRSTDKTAKVVQQYIEKYNLSESWKFYLNAQNKGYANNFHDALMMASGDIIFFCDQDDIWDRDKIKLMSEIMEKNDEIALLGSEFIPFYSSPRAPRYAREINEDGTLEKIELTRKTIFIDNGSEGCTVCIRKTFRDEIDRYWFSGFAHDEYVWKMALCKDQCFVWHKALMQRRFHDNNTSKQKLHNKEKRITFLRTLLKSHQAMLDYGNSIGIDAREKILLRDNIESVKLRIQVLENKNWKAWIKVGTQYLRYFQSYKSFFVEGVMAFFSDTK